MDPRTVHLKIKIKSLAIEATYIHREEIKTRARSRWHRRVLNEHDKADSLLSDMYVLREHRQDVVRYEARHNLLAYGCLRGVPYERMEKKCKREPDWGKIEDIARRFKGAVELEDIKAWAARAKGYLRPSSLCEPSRSCAISS